VPGHTSPSCQITVHVCVQVLLGLGLLEAGLGAFRDLGLGLGGDQVSSAAGSRHANMLERAETLPVLRRSRPGGQMELFAIY
jgi:hypothetical protein